jgi:hypothetical protein
MSRWAFAVGVSLALSVQTGTLAQARPDFAGTWKLNQTKSPAAAGNFAAMQFASEIVVTQTAAEIQIARSSVRQQPLSASYPLDGRQGRVQAAAGIAETGEARFEGANLIITSRRSFTSPLGETVLQLKEVWSVNGNVLTIEQTLTESGESSTEKAIYDKV